MEARKNTVEDEKISVGLFGENTHTLCALVDEIQGNEFAEFIFYDDNASWGEKQKAPLQSTVIMVIDKNNVSALRTAKNQLEMIGIARQADKSLAPHPRFILVALNDPTKTTQYISGSKCRAFLDHDLRSKVYIEFALANDDRENIRALKEAIVKEAALAEEETMVAHATHAEEKLALHAKQQAKALLEAKKVLEIYLQGTGFLFNRKPYPYASQVRQLVNSFPNFNSIADVVIGLDEIKKSGREGDPALNKCIEEVAKLSDSLRSKKTNGFRLVHK